MLDDDNTAARLAYLNAIKFECLWKRGIFKSLDDLEKSRHKVQRTIACGRVSRSDMSMTAAATCRSSIFHQHTLLPKFTYGSNGRVDVVSHAA